MILLLHSNQLFVIVSHKSRNILEIPSSNEKNSARLKFVKEKKYSSLRPAGRDFSGKLNELMSSDRETERNGRVFVATMDCCFTFNSRKRRRSESDAEYEVRRCLSYLLSWKDVSSFELFIFCSVSLWICSTTPQKSPNLRLPVSLSYLPEYPWVCWHLVGLEMRSAPRSQMLLTLAQLFLGFLHSGRPRSSSSQSSSSAFHERAAAQRLSQEVSIGKHSLGSLSTSLFSRTVCLRSNIYSTWVRFFDLSWLRKTQGFLTH